MPSSTDIEAHALTKLNPIMSIDRYIAVCRTFQPKLQKLRKRINAFIIGLSVWGICLLLCIPVMLYSLVRGNHPNCRCTYEFTNTNTTQDCERDYTTDLAIKNCKDLQMFYSPYNGMHGCKVFDHEKFHVDYLKNILNNGDFGSFTKFSRNKDGGSVTNSFSKFFSNVQDSAGLNISSTVAGGLNESMTGDREQSGAGANYPHGFLPGSFGQNFFRLGNSPKTTTNPSTLVNTTAPNLPGCYHKNNSDGFIAFIFFNFIVMFILPFLIMLVCYGLIVKRLFATRMRRTSITTSVSFTHSINSNGSAQKKRRRSTGRSDKDRQRVTIMCATLVFSFVLCWLPFHGIHMAKYNGISGVSTRYCHMLNNVGSGFAFLSAAINPYLYSFLGTHFARRWHFATSRVGKSFRRRASSSSGIGLGSAKYNQKRKDSSGSNNTVVTKIHKIDSKMVSESKDMSFQASTSGHPAKLNLSRTPPKEQCKSGTPPPDYERSLTMNDEAVQLTSKE